MIYYINDVTIDNEEVLVEYGAAGTATGTYEYGLQRLSVEYVNEAKEYYLYNGTGNVTQTTAENGSMFLRYTYDPFGNVTSINAPLTVDIDDLNRYTYNGEDYDYNTGLQYLRARYYSTGTGRFISQDIFLGRIFLPLSQNRFTYCQNNSVMRDDPSGFDSYIFYNSEETSGDGDHTFQDEADIVSEQLKEKYGTDVHLIDLSKKDIEYTTITETITIHPWWHYLWPGNWGKPSNKQVTKEVILAERVGTEKFIDQWNKMGSNGCEIDDVYIISHCVGSLVFDYDTGRSQFFSTSDVEKLDSKTMKTLTFSSCNSGDFARRFWDSNMQICRIIGYDGTVVFSYKDKKLTGVRGCMLAAYSNCTNSDCSNEH